MEEAHAMNKNEYRFLSLNDDCLLAIFQYLEIDDLLRVCEVSSFLQDLIRDHTMSVRLLDFLELTGYWNTNKIFKVFGKKLRRIKIGPYATNASFKHFLKLVTSYCERETMVELQLHFYSDRNEIPMDLLQRALPFFQTLKKLVLVGGDKSPIYTQFLKQLCLVPAFNLKVLTLSQLELDEEWSHSEKLDNLEEFRMHGSTSLGATHNASLIHLVQTKPKLKLFSYIGPCYYTPEIDAAIASCTLLESLTYFDDYPSFIGPRVVEPFNGIRLREICYLPALKHLSITSYNQDGSDIYTWLQKYSGGNALESLTITNNTRDVPLTNTADYTIWSELHLASTKKYFLWLEYCKNSNIFEKLTCVNIFIMAHTNRVDLPPSFELLYMFLAILKNLKKVTIRTELRIFDAANILDCIPQIQTLSLEQKVPNCFGMGQFAQTLKTPNREQPIHLIMNESVRQELQVSEKEMIYS